MRNNSNCHACSSPRTTSEAEGDGAMEWEFPEKKKKKVKKQDKEE